MNEANNTGSDCVGRTVGKGRYELLEWWGQGSQGNSYRAHDKQEGREIFIKLYSDYFYLSCATRQHFLESAKLTRKLVHPNIVRVFDIWENEADVFFTMEFLQGMSLGRYLRNIRQAQQIMTVSQALTIMDQICDALAYAHDNGAVHGAISLENLWLTPSGHAKLMEFGLGGTVDAYAPEQFVSNAESFELDGRADQYQLAWVLHVMLVGGGPTPGYKSLSDWRKDLSPSFSQVIEKALSTDKEQRYADMSKFRSALRC